MAPSENDPVRSVCIVMLSAIGDTVHVLPVANALKRAWPDVRISWIIQDTSKTLVEGHPAIDEMIEFDCSGGGVGIVGLLLGFLNRNSKLPFGLLLAIATFIYLMVDWRQMTL